MPWNEITPMDEKLLFISDWLREQHLPFAHLCQRYHISRKTGYKWVKRYQALNFEGLQEQSRKPHENPNQIPLVIRKRIIALRADSSITPGAKKIQARLKTLYPDITPPSTSSIYNILHAEGLIKRRKRRKPYDRYTRPLHRSTCPNQLWSVDFKGQFKLANGQWCYPLTLMDDYSRYLLGCECQESVATQATIKNFKRLFKVYGVPERIRSDNGAPFASKATAGLSRLSVWWIKLGIHPERIEPGKPQQNGRHERMHRTLKKYIRSQPPAASFKVQQKHFDAFKYAFNEERPHEALGLKTPAKCYHDSARPLPDKLPKPDYPSYFEVKKVGVNGVINWRGHVVYISHLLADEYVGLEEIDEGMFAIYFYEYKLGTIDVKQASVKSVSYLSIKV